MAAAPARKLPESMGLSDVSRARATMAARPPPTKASARGSRASGATRARISAMAGKLRARSKGGAANTSATSMP